MATKQELKNKLSGKTVLLQVVVDGIVMGTIPASFKEFKTGSLGFYANGKAALPSGERLQVGANLTIIGSKSLS
jgi:hypothetical protein